MTVATATPKRVEAGLGASSRAGLVAVIVLGPLSIAILRAVLPYSSADDAATIASKIAGHQTAQTAVLWLTLVAMVTVVPAVTAVGLLAARHARGLGTAGMILAVAGFGALWATTAVDFTALAGAQSGAGLDATTKIVDNLNANPAQLAATIVFVLGHIVGTIMLGVALLRGRAIPAWAAWALIVSQPLHLVFAVVVSSAPLDAAAWGLTTIGFAAAARAIVTATRTAS
jgi:hypothetical protein